ncbi:MAG: hypothetical protein Q7S40_31585 [Opitutaceae bacterium]|nr:hypothetical protein [Opitutaceae bacterium]
MNQSRAESLLRFVLRAIGGVSLLALVAVVMPYSWMDATHRWLGLGKLPSEPIVGYLARSLSAFYALLGGLFWMLSFDLPRHRPTVCFLGVATIGFGAILTGIDWAEGLPRYWKVWEGPWVMFMGAAIAWLAFRIKPRGNEAGGPSADRS